jgi:hypothetical protein
MGKRWRPAAGIALLLLALTACAGRVTGPSPDQPGVGSTSHSFDEQSHRFDEQEKANRKQAEDEVRRLLGLARIPPGAVALQSAPPALPGPVFVSPNVSTYASLTRSWRVPMSFAALEYYLSQHRPAGRAAGSDATISKDNKVTSHGYAWQEGPSQGSSLGGQLSISVAPADSPDVSYLRIDAGSEWLDPHPIKDTLSGARLRLDTGDSCPASSPGFVGVRNDGAEDLDAALAPNGAPTSGLVCLYGEGNAGQAFALLRQRTLSRTEVGRVATAARSVELAHRNGSVICRPAMYGSTIVVVLSYPSRPAVNLYLRTGDCSLAYNGYVIAPASPSLAALEDLVDQLAGYFRRSA